MAAPVKTGFPDGHTLSPSYIIRFRAVDPTTGADVAGVNVSGASLFVDNVGQVALVPSEPYQWVPNASASAV